MSTSRCEHAAEVADQPVIDVQGFYGGQLIGIGAAILLGVWNARLVVPALMLAVAPLAGTAVGRLYGVFATGTCPPLIAGVLVVEASTASVGWVLLRRELSRAGGQHELG
jgi:hypothetical protein